MRKLSSEHHPLSVLVLKGAFAIVRLLESVCKRVGCPRESRQAPQEPHVLCIELIAVLVQNPPHRADGAAADIERRKDDLVYVRPQVLGAG